MRDIGIPTLAPQLIQFNRHMGPGLATELTEVYHFLAVVRVRTPQTFAYTILRLMHPWYTGYTSGISLAGFTRGLGLRLRLSSSLGRVTFFVTADEGGARLIGVFQDIGRETHFSPA